jgi:type IV fimbrial biogenesis protein FimT
MTRSLRPSQGFTLIEMMVVVALAGVLLALAVPSFISTLARKKLEGAASELTTDIQYARSEAVQRNAPVGVVVQSNCYAVYVLGTTDATTCTALGTNAIALKTVQVPGGVTFNLVPPSPRAFIAFEQVRGMAVDATAGTTDLSGYVDATSSAGTWQIRAIVTKQGKVKLCSPNSSVTALATDCS